MRLIWWQWVLLIPTCLAHLYHCVSLAIMRARGVARGGSVGGSQIGRSVNPIQTRGDYAPDTTAIPPPLIQKAIYTSVLCNNKFNLLVHSLFNLFRVTQTRQECMQLDCCILHNRNGSNVFFELQISVMVDNHQILCSKEREPEASKLAQYSFYFIMYIHMYVENVITIRNVCMIGSSLS